MGCLLALLAKNAGAEKLIMVAPAGKRMDRARQLDVADRYVLALKEDVRGVILAETDGRGANVVLPATSNPAATRQCFELVDHRGRINLFSGLPKDQPEIQIDANKIHYGEWTVTGTAGASKDSMQHALELISSGQADLGRLVTHRFELDHLKEGLELTIKGEALKVAILP